MKRYVVKLPVSGYEVKEHKGKATYAILVRASMGSKWKIHSFYDDEDKAKEVIPTRESRVGEQVEVQRWEFKCVRPVEGWITGGK